MGYDNFPLLTGQQSPDEQLAQLIVHLSVVPRISAAVLFDGTVASPVATAAQNIKKTITKLGTGEYRLTFDSPYVGKRYGMHASLVTAIPLVAYYANKTETSIDVRLVTLAGVLTDCADCFISIVNIPS